MEENCWYFYSKVYKSDLSIGYYFKINNSLDDTITMSKIDSKLCTENMSNRRIKKMMDAEILCPCLTNTRYQPIYK